MRHLQHLDGNKPRQYQPTADLRNRTDYNRQSLDGVVREGLFARVEKVFEAFGWNIVRVNMVACCVQL